MILHCLADGQGHAASEFSFSQIDAHRVEEALGALLNSEAITFDGALFYKATF